MSHIEIDKDFYEANMDEECQGRSMLSERDYARMFGKKGKELLKYSAELPLNISLSQCRRRS